MMNYASMRYLGIILCLLLSSAMCRASEKPAAQKYTFADTELNKDRFLAGLNDLTEDNYAYCMWAAKRELSYWSQANSAGYYPLEIIIKLYSTVDSARKERYKNLCELLMRVGATLAADYKTSLRVTDTDLANSAQLGVLWETYLPLRDIFDTALKAVKDKKIHELDAVLKDNPLLVKIFDPTTQRTLLHEAATHFSSKDPASVQMFAHLMRKGADYEMPNGEGKSVAALMEDGTHEASVLFKNEKEALKKQGEPLISFQAAKKKVEPFFAQVAPYKYYLGFGMATVCALWYLITTSAHKNSRDSDTATLHLEQLA